jgi:hypothetical protein
MSKYSHHRPTAAATPRMAASNSGALMGCWAAPTPMATTDSPMARMMNSPCRSVRWATLCSRQLPCLEVR